MILTAKNLIYREMSVKIVVILTAMGPWLSLDKVQRCGRWDPRFKSGWARYIYFKELRVKKGNFYS